MIFLHYLRDRFLALVFLLGVFLIFGFLSFLYNYDQDMLVYAFLLVFIFVFLLGCYDFVRYRKQHLTLVQLQREVNVSLSHYIEDPSLKGEDYKKILETMEASRIHALEENQVYQKELLDYFTLWAHQAKLPLAAMRLCLESENVDVKEMKNQLLRIEQYTEMVLAYLRMQSASSDYVFREYALDDLIRQAIRYFSSEFINRKIHLVYEPIDQRILTDEKWFVFVLEQILSNALKYTDPQGCIRIYVQDNALCIEDTGIGIEAGDLHRIFEKGYTGYNGRQEKKASGLGLYLCQQILSKLNHTLEIESKRYEGTRVWIHFERYEFSILDD